MTTVLFTHPSAELYGSDRTLLQLVEHLRQSPEFRCVVALPRRGVLAEALEAAGATVEIGQLGAALRSDLMPGRLPSFLRKASGGARFVKSLVEKHRVDVVHTNTSVLVGAAFGAHRSSAKHLWHIHEILDHPAWAAPAMRTLIRRWSDLVVANSKATGNAMIDRRVDRAEIVPNGVEPRRIDGPFIDPAELRRSLGLPESGPIVVLPGRINGWKGQGLLVEAAALCQGSGRRAHFVFAGDPPPGQDHFAADLDRSIEAHGLGHRMTRVPFTNDLPSLLAAASLCAVPSTRPEPFGLVSIEAMGVGTPVVAAGHGGLLETVRHGEDGLHFSPGDAKGLADAIDACLGDEVRLARMGGAGQRRVRQDFTAHAYGDALASLYGELSPAGDARFVA